MRGGLLSVDTDWLLPELEGLVNHMTTALVNINTSFHSIQFYLHSTSTAATPKTLNEEFELCYHLLTPLLQAMLIITRIRRDIFDKYTPIFNPLISQFQSLCSLFSSFLSQMKDENLILLKRLILLCIHIINSFPAYILISGCDYYLPLTLHLVSAYEEKTTLSDELLSKEDDVLLMKNKAECVISYMQLENTAKITRKRNPFDYEDETL